jgi:hypothetical protein
MKTPITLFAALLAWGASGQILAQDTNSPAGEVPAISPESSSLPIALAAGTNDRTAPVVSAELYRNLGLAELGVSTNALVISSGTNRLDLIEARRLRLEGSLVPAIKRPSLATFLQLVNPFAPSEYGGTRVSAAGQGFGRVFDDPIEAKTGVVLLSVGDNPLRSNEPTRLDSD